MRCRAAMRDVVGGLLGWLVLLAVTVGGGVVLATWGRGLVVLGVRATWGCRAVLRDVAGGAGAVSVTSRILVYPSGALSAGGLVCDVAAGWRGWACRGRGAVIVGVLHVEGSVEDAWGVRGRTSRLSPNWGLPSLPPLFSSPSRCVRPSRGLVRCLWVSYAVWGAQWPAAPRGCSRGKGGEGDGNGGDD
ncbi:hypothetical protein FPV67DRAFT_1454476 [Lyophyllum atratum]|nr:hypothetical protein FPV67DRAFT_1454476 [Lyophyllum atratum]